MFFHKNGGPISSSEFQAEHISARHIILINLTQIMDYGEALRGVLWLDWRRRKADQAAYSLWRSCSYISPHKAWRIDRSLWSIRIRIDRRWHQQREGRKFQESPLPNLVRPLSLLSSKLTETWEIKQQENKQKNFPNLMYSSQTWASGELSMTCNIK